MQKFVPFLSKISNLSPEAQAAIEGNTIILSHSVGIFFGIGKLVVSLDKAISDKLTRRYMTII